MSTRYLTSEDEKNIELLKDAIQRIEGRAREEKRFLNGEEAHMKKQLESALDELLHIPYPPQTLERNFTYDSSGRRVYGNTRTGGPYELRSPKDSKDYTTLFGDDGYKWPDRNVNFFSAVFSGRHHEGLTTRSMTIGIPSDGGFLIPSETAARIHNVSLESEIVQPRAFVQPMRTNEIKIPAMSIGSHAASLFGGFIASYTAELGTINEADPKVRSMTLSAKKLTGLIRFSSELSADVPGGMTQIETLCGRGLAWYRDKAFLKGTGAGQPLGILNAPCLITQDKELGQKADSICYENLCKVFSRMFPGSVNNSVWVFHPSAIPQLLTLSLAVGVGGSGIPVMTNSNGAFTILTRPVLFSEKMEKLGDKGDCLLADFSQYVVGLRNEMRFDTSIHVAFSTDEIVSRIIERHDGQPLWDSALTLADGVNSVSPFVTLGERA